MTRAELTLELQKVEAKIFRQQFEASLKIPLDAGDDILNRARALRDELEDLAAADSASTDPDEKSS